MVKKHSIPNKLRKLDAVVVRVISTTQAHIAARESRDRAQAALGRAQVYLEQSYVPFRAARNEFEKKMEDLNTHQVITIRSVKNMERLKDIVDVGGVFSIPIKIAGDLDENVVTRIRQVANEGGVKLV